MADRFVVETDTTTRSCGNASSLESTHRSSSPWTRTPNFALSESQACSALPLDRANLAAVGLGFAELCRKQPGDHEGRQW